MILAATSTLRQVGDGGEYLRMAQRLAAGQPVGGASRHFWFYPALAAPLVRLLSAIHGNPLLAFTVVNIALLTIACWVLARRVDGAALLLLMVCPIIWWVDKAHTEAFTFALLAVAFALIRDAPWWSMPALSVAATQNLPIALVLPVFAAAGLLRCPSRIRDVRSWAGSLAAAALVGLVIAYNLRTSGTPAPLLHNPHLRVPTAAELGAALWDLNLGLFVNFAALAPAVIVLAFTMALGTPRALMTPEVGAGVLTGAMLAVSVAQASNFNYGGTPGMSRYALWLIPATVPIFMRAAEVLEPARRRWMAPVAIVSAAWCLFYFSPRVPEGGTSPTALARYVWTHHPWLDNPLPEVFAERLAGNEDDFVPIATPGCEKVLLSGRGGHDGMWPIPCPPAPLPPACVAPGALCYANRTKTGYDFVILPRRGDAFKLKREVVWPQATERVAMHVFESARWWELTSPADMVRQTSGAKQVAGLQSADRLVVFIGNTDPSASLTLNAARAMTGRLVDATSGEQLASYSLQPGASAVPLPERHSPSMLVLAASDRQ